MFYICVGGFFCSLALLCLLCSVNCHVFLPVVSWPLFILIFGSSRYKFVVNVTIGQKAGQSLDISSRCIWNKDFDSMASGSFESPSLYAVGIVFGCYVE